MARLFVFECKACNDFIKVKRVEYTPPSNSKQIDAARYVIDISSLTDHDGYPEQKIPCEKCKALVKSRQYDASKIPPVYFNYMGDN
jgi:hypothetical protein